jgi:Gas vesicle protein G
MSLFEELLLLPVAPVRGVAWFGARIAEQAEEQLAVAHDPRRALEDIEAARDRGELAEEEYAAAEEALLRELVPQPIYLEPLDDELATADQPESET